MELLTQHHLPASYAETDVDDPWTRAVYPNGTSVIIETRRFVCSESGRTVTVNISESRFAMNIVLNALTTSSFTFISHTTIGVLFPHFTLNYQVVVKDYPSKELVMHLRVLRSRGFTTHSTNSFVRGACRSSCTVQYHSFNIPNLCIIAFGRHGTPGHPLLLESARDLVVETEKTLHWRFDTVCCNTRCERTSLLYVPTRS